jgi:hypothetical protein
MKRSMLTIVALGLAAVVECAIAQSTTYKMHTYTDFSIQLPAAYEKQPQKCYSDVFLFRLRREDRPDSHLSFQRRVSNRSSLGKLTAVEIMDVIFQSSADYPRHYSDFRPETDEGPFKDWIFFKKEKSKSTYFAARFKILKRTRIVVPGTQGAEFVLYESEREHPGSFVDEQGNDGPAPKTRTKHCVYVVDTGHWKYVFSVRPVPDKDTMKAITEGIQGFRETAKGRPINAQMPAGLVAATAAQKEFIARVKTLSRGMPLQAAKRHLGAPTKERAGSLFYNLTENRVEGGHYVTATLTFDDSGLVDVKMGFGHESRSPRTEE